MNIINYKDIDTIIPAHDTMIYCTCAEKNQIHYLEKINVWFNRYKHLDGDFYVFNDGHILEENKQIEFDDRIIFVEFDENYGRPDSYSAVFPGWKRSFCYAMKLSLKYEYFCHIENDTFIKDINLFYVEDIKRLIEDYINEITNYKLKQRIEELKKQQKILENQGKIEESISLAIEIAKVSKELKRGRLN
jgi:hypothetical protein